MRTLRNIAILAATACLGLPGCQMDWPHTADTLSRDERCMIFPSQAPSDDLFVAIRGDGTILLGDPDAELERPADMRPIRTVVARPLIPPGAGELIEPQETGAPGQVLEPSTQRDR